MAYEEKLNEGGATAVSDWTPVDEEGHRKNSSQIENDIRQARHSMDTIFDELGDRLNPKHAFRQILDYMQNPQNRREGRDKIAGMGEKLTDSFQGNPIPFVLMGAGLAWMLWDYQSRGETGARAEGAAESARQTASGPAQQAGEKGEQLRQSMQQASRMAKGKASEFAQGAGEGYQRGAEAAGQFLRDNPLTIGLAAMFLGSLAAMMIPESKKEREIAGEKAREIKESVKRAGEQVMEKGREVAAESGKAASQKAKQEGLTPQSARTEAEQKLAEATGRKPK